MKIGMLAMTGLMAAALPALAQTQPAAPPRAPVPARSVLGHPVPIHHPPPRRKTPVVQPPHGARPVKTAIRPAAKPAVAPVSPAPPPAAAAPQPPPPTDKSAAPDKGTVTGLPLPRFVSLRTDDVNMRSGPGMRYPVEWQYHRRGLPVEIEREFDVWRLVVDQDGVRGWMHEATIVSGRTFVVTGGEHALRASAANTAAPVALLKPGVVGRIRHCGLGQDWCQLQVGAYRGWMKRADFWGTFPGEAVN
jgi:SH3-like domain-containing protein